MPKAGSVGAPLPGVEVELLDPDGEPVEDDDPGQLAVRGANLFSGYWPDGNDGPDADGWFVTGDLGYVDDDGDLVLVGRDSELVLVNGFNVYPAEVEEVLRRHESVAAVAVLGVARRERRGEAVRALRRRRCQGTCSTPDDLLASASRVAGRFKLPRQLEIVQSLPYTLTGKVKKWQLRAEAGSRARPGTRMGEAAEHRPRPVVTVVTRAGCHLCQEAETRSPMSSELGFGWTTWTSTPTPRAKSTAIACR